MLSPTPGQRTEDSGIESQSSPELEEVGARTMSITHQYRKVMKPMLERKRRARINNCLDELKDLMVGALQTEGESITKLEKADVLELTVRHLRKLKAHGALGLTPTTTYVERYRAGYSLCATEVSKFVTSGAAGVEVPVAARLLHHLSLSVRGLDSGPRPLSPTSLQMLRSPSTASLQMLRSPSTNTLQMLRCSMISPQQFSPPEAARQLPNTGEKAWRPW